MLTGLDISDRRVAEAYGLCFDGQVRLNKNVDGLAVSGQATSVADKAEKTKQVLGKPSTESGDCPMCSFKLEQGAISPKAAVCMHAGQYLPCGIGFLDHMEISNITSVDIRRWELCASAICEILKTTSPRNEYPPADTVKVKHLDKFLAKRELDKSFAMHIPNLRKDEIWHSWKAGYLESGRWVLRSTKDLFLYLLRFFIPLTAAYGGIHLSAWNFEFPSRAESVIWRTACFIIMGSSFALLSVPLCTTLQGKIDRYPYVFRPSKFQLFLRGEGTEGIWNLLSDISGIMFIVLAVLLLLCYAASRIYLVVESFISLRHVPIGVYAAVPWVENIPHV